MMKLRKYFYLRFLPIPCNHEFMVHGWSFVKCKKCGQISSDEKLVNLTFDNFLESRTRGMKKAGFEENFIISENSKINPLP